MAHKPPSAWPLYLISASAFAAIWSGWVGLGEKTGFGVVHPLPGIADTFTLNTAITLPLGVEAYAFYSMNVWLTGAAIKPGTRAFAKWSAIGALFLGGLGQVAYHLLESLKVATTPAFVVVLVSCLPVVVIGFGAGLTHALRRDLAMAKDLANGEEMAVANTSSVANGQTPVATELAKPVGHVATPMAKPVAMAKEPVAIVANGQTPVAKPVGHVANEVAKAKVANPEMAKAVANGQKEAVANGGQSVAKEVGQEVATPPAPAKKAPAKPVATQTPSSDGLATKDLARLTLLANPGITVEELAVAIDKAPRTARRYLEAFNREMAMANGQPTTMANPVANPVANDVAMATEEVAKP
ncbi:hypothetical protein ACIBI0_38595 [Microbispora rosea]|uniref:hypothetical protein n=1 Tax=Microbispora rosea TaxID=58117 RepID=UPI0037BD71D9